MEAKDITEEALRNYLKHRGTSEKQLFSESSLFRHTQEGFTHLNAMYEHFTGFEMTSEGLTFDDPEEALRVKILNMTDFNRIITLEEAVINMKYINHLKEVDYIEARRIRELEQNTDEPELER